MSVATFAGGCFWGLQKWFTKQFGDAIQSSVVGFIGGNSSHSSYEDVRTGNTGHAEALQINFDPAKVSYAQLCEYFFRIHDPTQLNRQGNDMGTQYRSAIFVHDAEQETIAKSVLDKMNKEKWGGQIKTTIEKIPQTRFVIAESYHQNYLGKNPGGYCNHKPRW